MTTLIGRLLIVINHALAVGGSLAAAKERSLYAVIRCMADIGTGRDPGFAVNGGENMMKRAIAGGRRCRARVLVALACALAAGVASADDAARGEFAVWAIGLPGGYVMMEHQAPVIHVTADDVAQGVVHVRGGSRLVITTDAPSGYTVDFHTRSALFQAVQIDGIGSAVELGPKGGTVAHQQAAAGRRVIALSYRFILASDTNPGTYAWPLALAVRGMVTSDLQHLSKDRLPVMLSGRAEP